MATKAQISRKVYGCVLSELSGGEKAAVTRKFNAQELTPAATPARRGSGSGTASVKFGRPGINGVKECLVNTGTSVKDALAQAGVSINASKEGILEKTTGKIIMFNDSVVDNTTYIIAPGVDSSN